jgi:hypothetical protein
VVGQVVRERVCDAGARLVEPIADLRDLELIRALLAAELVVVQAMAKDVVQLAYLCRRGTPAGIDVLSDFVQKLAQKPEAFQPLLGSMAVPSKPGGLYRAPALADQVVPPQPIQERVDVGKRIRRAIALELKRIREFDEQLVG